MYKLFADQGVVIDPEILESKGAAFVISDDFVSSADGHAQWAYIKAKYGALTNKMLEVEFNGVAVCPHPNRGVR